MVGQLRLDLEPEEFLENVPLGPDFGTTCQGACVKQGSLKETRLATINLKHVAFSTPK